MKFSRSCLFHCMCHFFQFFSFVLFHFFMFFLTLSCGFHNCVFQCLSFFSSVPIRKGDDLPVGRMTNGL